MRTLRVERAERLIKQQHARLDRQRAGERHPLALAAGEFGRIAVGQSIDLDELEERAHALGDLHLRRPGCARPHAQSEGDVFEHPHVPEQGIVLKNEAHAALAGANAKDAFTLESHITRIRPIETGDDAQKSRFAGTGRPEKRQQFALPNAQVHALEHYDVIEALGEVDGFDGQWPAPGR